MSGPLPLRDMYSDRTRNETSICACVDAAFHSGNDGYVVNLNNLRMIFVSWAWGASASGFYKRKTSQSVMRCLSFSILLSRRSTKNTGANCINQRILLTTTTVVRILSATRLLIWMDLSRPQKRAQRLAKLIRSKKKKRFPKRYKGTGSCNI